MAEQPPASKQLGSAKLSAASAPEQLALRLRARSGASFANFVVAAANSVAVRALQGWLQAAEPGIFYLFGEIGSGRSHLLQAASAANAALYAPLRELRGEDPAVLFEGFERAELVCIDDIDIVLDDRYWCEQLFALFNRLTDARSKLLVSAVQAAATLPCVLPDLRSRLAWGGSFHLLPLDDNDRQQALRLLARERGFDLSDEVLAYLFARYTRDLPALVKLLDELDKHSLAQQKRITVPFVRQWLDAASGPAN
jgi:DnaA family protein